MKTPPIAGFVEKQLEAKTWAWSGKSMEGRAYLSDCHKIAKIISDEDALQTNYHPCFKTRWNLVSNFSSESTFIFNFNIDDVM